jgi:hypothetical protein
VEYSGLINAMKGGGGGSQAESLEKA